MDTDISQSMASIAAATGRLLTVAGTLTDAEVAEPSLLPGWTRGHVLTHLARNADGLANLLRWAGTGIETPVYASAQARAADIAAGAGRPAADLAADLTSAADAFAARAAQLPDDAWTTHVRLLTGPPFPASGVLQLRLSEVEIHHVDLAAGYRPGDWPAGFVAAALAAAAGSFASREDIRACVVLAADTGARFRIGRAGPVTAPTVVRGPAATVLAWLIGRDSGGSLQVTGDDPVLPALPAWRLAAPAASFPSGRNGKGDTVTYTGDVSVGGPPDTRAVPGLTITKLAVGPMDNNAYLLRCPQTGEQVLIDAANEADRLLELTGGELTAIVTTHRHFDHWQALAEVQAATGAKVIAHPDDAAGLPLTPASLVRGGDRVVVGAASLSVIHLRGHTPGSIALCYDAAGALATSPHLFTGDSLFPGGPGNTEHDPERFGQLMDDLAERVFGVLPDGTWVYPGHGKDTTLGAERPHLAEWRERGW